MSSEGTSEDSSDAPELIRSSEPATPSSGAAPCSSASRAVTGNSDRSILRARRIENHSCTVFSP